MSIIIKFTIFFLNIIYFIFKLFPVQNKITYISRQYDNLPKDFELIINNIKSKDQNIKHKVLAKRIPNSLIGKLKYCFHIFTQMYHIATSKIVILDTYCIPVSILKMRKDLVVIQMWHALGALKKFGYSILDQKEGSSSKLAHLMKMHHNYTYVLSSSEFTKTYFSEAFNVDINKVKVFPLPKTDLLLNKLEINRIKASIYDCYPNLKTKLNIVYAPTFRKNDESKLESATKTLIDCINFNNYNLIIKLHPLTKFEINDRRVILDDKFISQDIFHIADFIITDYSAVIFEASMLEKPLYLYAFDKEQYLKDRSFYIDYDNLPGLIIDNPKDLVTKIESNIYDLNKIKEFKNKMIATTECSYTDDLVDRLILPSITYKSVD